MAKKQKRKRRGTLGIDIGGTKSLYALFDERFEVLAEEKFRSHPPKGGLAAFEAKHASAVAKLLREARRRKMDIEAVGMGIAGRVDLREGVVLNAPSLEFLQGYAFQQRLEKQTGSRVFVCNDVHAGLYGELMQGAARGGRDIIGIWLGTGVGGALVIGGRLHMGASGLAGDIGNYLLQPVDADKDAPRKQVLDSVASRTAIAADAAALAAKKWGSKLRKIAGTDVRDITSGSIAKAIRRGDKAVEKLVRSRAQLLGAVLSNLVDFINPDMVVLGGGLVSAIPKLIRREIEKSIQAHASTRAAQAVKVVSSKLGDHAGTTGAARLALDMYSGRPPIELEARGRR
ncbi:MAG TPA: ROK family protein [Usitatibacter sp.]|nr:ROK family protein [Usitatibacter sp.]